MSRIPENEIIRFYSEDKGVLIEAESGVFSVRERLYELEERFQGTKIVRVSNSEIVNLYKIQEIDLSFTGTIKFSMYSGSTVYVSRRYVKKIKKVLGL